MKFTTLYNLNHDFLVDLWKSITESYLGTIVTTLHLGKLESPKLMQGHVRWCVAETHIVQHTYPMHCTFTVLPPYYIHSCIHDVSRRNDIIAFYSFVRQSITLSIIYCSQSGTKKHMAMDGYGYFIVHQHR